MGFTGVAESLHDRLPEERGICLPKVQLCCDLGGGGGGFGFRVSGFGFRV